jgi:hypothetical protein
MARRRVGSPAVPPAVVRPRQPEIIHVALDPEDVDELDLLARRFGCSRQRAARIAIRAAAHAAKGRAT